MHLLQSITDAYEIVKSSPPGEELVNLWAKYGIRLQSYICEDILCADKSREEILRRAMTFTLVAKTYCQRIYEVYFTAIP